MEEDKKQHITTVVAVAANSRAFCGMVCQRPGGSPSPTELVLL